MSREVPDLLSNIEKVKINGRPHLLNEPISSMQNCVINMCNYTDAAIGAVSYSSGFLAGMEYDRSVEALRKLAQTLRDTSDMIYSMQVQIYRLEETICRFEGEAFTGIPPSKPDVPPIPELYSAATFQFDRSVATKLLRIILDYIDNVRKESITLTGKALEIRSIWDDPQYVKFINFIYDVREEIDRALFDLRMYRDVLYSKVMDM